MGEDTASQPALRSFDSDTHVSLEDLSQQPLERTADLNEDYSRKSRRNADGRRHLISDLTSQHEEDEDLSDDRRSGFFAGLRHPGSSHWGPWHVAALTAVLATLVFGGLFAWRWMHRPVWQAAGVVIFDFRNATGVAQFDPSLTTAVHLDLEQSPRFHVASQANVEQALAQMKLPAGKGITPELAGEACRRLNGQIYLNGEIHNLASGYLLTVQAFQCDGGRSLAVSRGIADTTDGVVSVLDRVVDDLRKQLGESAASVARFSKPLFAGRTSSLDALKAFADGDRLANAGKLQDAVAPLQHAVEIDPELALAFADLGGVYADLGERELATAALTRAFELRSTVDDRDRLFIAATYNTIVTGDIQASIHNYKDWIAEYPNNPLPQLKLAELDVQIGNAAQALGPAQRSLELDPANPEAYVVLARAQMHLDQFEQAADTCRLAISRHLDQEQIHEFLLQMAFLRLDQATIDQQLAWAKNTEAEPYMQLQQGYMDFYQGKVKAGTAIISSVAEGFRKLGQEERAYRTLEPVPRIEAEFGSTDAARSMLNRLPETDDSPDVLVALAHLGETTRANSRLKGELDTHLANTLWQEYRGPQIRAAIALNEQRPAEAIDDLKPALPYDLSGFDLPALRGRAYLMAKQPALAFAEFHKIFDHSGIDPLSHDYALAQLGIARALAQEGDTADASFAYKLVLSIWKDADPDLPRFKEAKAEYARLAGEPFRTNPAVTARPAHKPPSGRR